MLIHILGSDIPHHNLTVLRFFNDVLLPQTTADKAAHFMVVTQNVASLADFERLNISAYPDKSSLAQAVIARGKVDKHVRFFFHGQFNVKIWLALLFKQIDSRRVSWHIWGADLYEDSPRWTYRLFYRLRRIAQGKVGHVFATRGDIRHYQQRHRKVACSLLYFPTRMDPAFQPNVSQNAKSNALTILVGNSGDRTNRHLAALQEIHARFDHQALKIIIPLGYPAHNDAYIAEIRAKARSLFAENQVELLTASMPFEAYLRLLAACDLGYFIFHRQQGIGTLCLLIQCNVPFVISRNNPFWHDLQEQQVPFLFYGDNISDETVTKTKRALETMDKRHIAFFNPNYVDGWLRTLAIASGEETECN